MTVVQADVKHKTQTTKADDPDYDVSADEWNEGHNVTVGIPSDIGTANAEGSSTELARKDHVHNHPLISTGDLHDEYAKLAGRAGGQTLIGGIGSGEHLYLESTSNATKGFIFCKSQYFLPENPWWVKKHYCGTASYSWYGVNANQVIALTLRLNNGLIYCDATKTLTFRGGGAAGTIVAQITATPSFDIPVAGDITIIANKTFTSGVGTKHDGLVTKPAAEVQTTDATQTTLDSITLLDENTYQVEAFVSGVKSDGSQRASYHIACTVYRTAAGGATLQGAVTSVHTQESDANWDVTFTVNGNDLRVSVTGVAATTIEWGCTMIHMNMSN